MKHDKLTYNWMRWLTILLFSGLSCLGIIILYHILFADPTTVINNLRGESHKWFIVFIGVAFTGGGLSGAITNYLSGDAYFYKSKVLLKDLDLLYEYDRGIVVALNNKAILIDYTHKKILKRGYVRTMTNHDRKQEIKNWYFLVD